MRRILLLFLPLTFSSALLFTQNTALAADPRPKADRAGQPGGDSPAAPQASNEDSSSDSNADSDAEKIDTETPQPHKITSRPTSIGITTVRSGLKAITIHFRWSLYPNALVEIRLVPNPVPKKVAVRPVFFFENLNGKVQDELYTCLDHAGEGGHKYNFTKNRVVYDMIGRRNSLGYQGVHVHVVPEGAEATDEPSTIKPLPKGVHVHAGPHMDDLNAPDPHSGAVYLQLDTWAVNKDIISLDLARDEFARPGMLFVWFFRGERVVWQEQLHWSGYGPK